MIGLVMWNYNAQKHVTNCTVKQYKQLGLEITVHYMPCQLWFKKGQLVNKQHMAS